MTTTKDRNLITSIMPILQSLASDWFEPGNKNEEDISYGCCYCDLNCGRDDKHDYDCFYQLAKDAVEQFQKIDQDPGLFINIFEEKRSNKEILDLCNSKKSYYLMKHFFSKALPLLGALDYSDPANKCTVCRCFLFNSKNEHTEDCPDISLTNCLVEYLK